MKCKRVASFPCATCTPCQGGSLPSWQNINLLIGVVMVLDYKMKDLTGERFGHLLVESPIRQDKWGKVIWSCNCDCGNKGIEVRGSHLISGHTHACGCYGLTAVNKTGYCKMWRRKEFVEVTAKRGCEGCGITPRMNHHLYGRLLSRHHINGNKSDCSPLNLAVLCDSCHSSIGNMR